jgi:DMSO/TMAO reductase YedYZ heme-binding membrane subunit
VISARDRVLYLTACLVWFVCVFGVMLGCAGDDDAYSRALACTRGFGWFGLGCLCAALCVTPLTRLATRISSFADARDPRLFALRRSFGLAAFAAAALHVSVALGGVPGTWIGLLDKPSLRAGLSGLLILALLALTSFPVLVRFLRLRLWKELHRLAYAALACASLHVLLGPFVPVRAFAWLAGGTLVIGLLRVLPRAHNVARETDAARDRSD